MSSPFIIIDEIESAISAVETKIDTVDGIVDTINSNVNTIKTATAASTSASASGTLSQKLSWIGNTLIGATNNTGGTTTAGTVMAKLNAILSKTNSVTASVSGSPVKIAKDYKYISLGSADYSKTVLNVTGSGSLISVHYKGNVYAGNYATVKITIDGTIKYYIKMQTTTTNQNQTYKLVLHYPFYLASYDGYVCVPYITANGTYSFDRIYTYPSDNSPSENYLQPSSSMQTLSVGSNSYDAYQSVFTNPLKFNSSCKVEIYATNNSSSKSDINVYTTVQYTLD